MWKRIQNAIRSAYERLDRTVTARLPESAKNPPPDAAASARLNWKSNLYWFLLWSILPLIALGNDFIDILENIVWGSHFQFGYDKNPYLGAWIGRFGYIITGGGLWINYIFSQIFVITGFWAIWKLAQRFLTPAKSFLAVLFLWGITFYGMKAAELCDDVMELGVWPLIIYFFYRALRDDRKLLFWCLTGLFAGCALMIKYFAPVLFGSMLLVLLFTPEGRKAFRQPGIYLAGVIALAISLPNFLWLYENQMVAVDYAFERAEMHAQPQWFSLKYVFRSIERAFAVLIVPAAIYFILLFRREKAASPASEERFNRIFLHIMMWGPYASTLLFSFITGGKVNYSWVLPCFSLLGIYFLYFYRPRLDAFSVKAVTTAMLIISIVFGAVFVVRSVYQQPYRKRSCDYETYPGRAISTALTQEWRERFGTPLPYIIGNRLEACNVAVYSPDRPEAFFSNSTEFSQWIDEDDVRRRGGIILWEERKQGEIKWLQPALESYPVTETVTVDFDRATPAWARKLFGQPKQFRASYCFIPPALTHTSWE